MERVPGLRSIDWAAIGERARLLMGDALWYVRNRPQILRYVAALIGVGFLIYAVRPLFAGGIYPNTKTMGLDLGGMSAQEAENALSTHWRSEMTIDLVLGGEVLASLSPQELGLTLDAAATADDANGGFFSGFPFGREVEPIVAFEFLTAQNTLLELTETFNQPPQNAGYALEDDGSIVGVEGRSGRMLDVTRTLEHILANPALVAQRGRVEVQVNPLPADYTDPDPYLEDARAVISQSITLTGYDPFVNQYITWRIPESEFAAWIEAGPNALVLRQGAFIDYVDVLNETLNPPGENTRYLAPEESMDHIRRAIAEQTGEATVRVRYRETFYEVERGDTAFGIARRSGIPYYKFVEANSGRDLNVLSVGDTLRIPSRDITLEYDPIPGKRIIVDLSRQLLVAFEDGQVVFEWAISSGVDQAPTSPGIYQILSHEEVAFGSSNYLCNDAGLECGQWAMNWFMGMYRVTPELVNGFHGFVRLPSGNLLGGGAIGRPNTFGCVMSNDDNALALYEWAEEGTVVEIISNEFEPVSDLARLVWEGQFDD
jgi:hypothetical protein